MGIILQIVLGHLGAFAENVTGGVALRKCAAMLLDGQNRELELLTVLCLV